MSTFKDAGSSVILLSTLPKTRVTVMNSPSDWPPLWAGLMVSPTDLQPDDMRMRREK